MAADDRVKGFILGGLIGAALGILYAPKSGEKTREDILNSAEELLEEAKCRYDEACHKIETLADREKESIRGKKEQLKRAIEAGIEAFKEERTGTLSS
jgi:gas vesicle protein